MQVSEIKQQLHEVIDAIKDEGYLQALLTILLEKRSPDKCSLSDEQIQQLKEREEKYRNGQSKAVPLEEFKGEMSKKYGL